MSGRLRHLAQCARGLEQALISELTELGASAIEPVAGGALFEGDRRLAARAVLWLRSAVRVLEPVTAGEVEDFDDLYQLVADSAWEDLIGSERTLAVQATVSHASISDRRFTALKTKDAIVDRIRSRRGSRPNVDRHDPDVPVRVVVRGARAHVYRDLAGASLHRRGHRPVQVKSPLSEAVAAGLLLLTDWDRRSPLIDPMCGSGTFVIEAAGLAADRAPGLGRSFAAERYPDVDARLWRELREEAHERLRETLPFPLLGGDRHPGAVGIARKVARDAGVSKLVRFTVADAGTAAPPWAPSIVVANPPWGGRLGRTDRELLAAWRALGSFLRRCPGATAYILSGDRTLTRHLGLKSSRRWPLRIAKFNARWLRYELHERTARVSSQAPPADGA